MLHSQALLYQKELPENLFFEETMHCVILVLGFFLLRQCSQNASFPQVTTHACGRRKFSRGRLFTEAEPSFHLQNTVKSRKSNFPLKSYRRFLTLEKQAAQLFQENRREYEKKVMQIVEQSWKEV